MSWKCLASHPHPTGIPYDPPGMDDETRERMNRESEDFGRRLSEQLGVPYRSMYYGRDSEPIGLGDWAALHQDREYRAVAHTVLAAGESRVEVCTDWVGNDMSHGFGPPLMFETMVAVWSPGGGVGWADEYTQRYGSEEDALHGHVEVVEALEEQGHKLLTKEERDDDD